MPSKADLIASLRADMEAIARGDAPVAAEAPEEAPRHIGALPLDDDRVARGAGEAGEDAPAGEGAAGDAELTAERAFQKILRLAAAREQSTARIRARLARDGWGEAEAEDALSRAVRAGAVDDRRYAEALVRMRIASGRGVEGVLAEVEDLGIDPWDLESYAEYRAAGDDADVDRALALLGRRPPRAKNQRDAAFRKLVQQGFGTATAATAARRWSESRQ